MPILGIGVDIVHVPRIAKILQRTYGSRLATKILSPPEQARWGELHAHDSPEETRLRFLAVRWCVKEAAYKAMYPTAKPSWKELTYTSLSNGIKPSLVYSPNAPSTEKAFESIHVSVSHDGEYIFSQVLVEGHHS